MKVAGMAVIVFVFGLLIGCGGELTTEEALKEHCVRAVAAWDANVCNTTKDCEDPINYTLPEGVNETACVEAHEVYTVCIETNPCDFESLCIDEQDTVIAACDLE